MGMKKVKPIYCEQNTMFKLIICILTQNQTCDKWRKGEEDKEKWKDEKAKRFTKMVDYIDNNRFVFT